MAFNLYMHERNIYRNQPDFTQMALDFPAFRKYAVPDATGKKVHVDFTNPDALRMVTEILLRKDFNLDVEIPQGYLIPTVPQRLNYILWLEDLLHNIPQKKNIVCGIDIGTGPCAIFSILGARKNNWNYIATETSDDAMQWAKKNIAKNNLEDNIKIVKVSPDTTLSEVLSSNEESYDFCLCNPPFFTNIEEVRKKHHNSKETIADIAQKEEIFFNGGELNFVKDILKDSLMYKDRISLFTSMFGKKKNFLEILHEIKEIEDAKVTTTEFCQGNTVRWGVAWTFNKTIQFEKVDRKVKPKKAKPPLEYQIPLKNSKDFDLRVLLKQAENFLKSLLIPVTVARASQYFVELLLKSDKNTWTHQRRKRREIQRQKKEVDGLNNEISETVALQGHLNSADSEAIQKPSVDIDKSINPSENNIATAVDMNVCTDTERLLEHSKVSNENVTSSDCKNKTFIKKEAHDKMHQAISRPVCITADSLNSENVSLNNKRKDVCHGNSSTSKKSRLDSRSENEDNSKACTNLSLESSESDFKESCALETSGVFTEMESDGEHSKTTSQITPDNDKIQVPKSLPSKNDSEKFEFESQTLLEESPERKQSNCLSLQSKNSDLSSHKNEDKSMNLKSNELDSSGKVESFNSQQGSVLHCNLQMIKGKNKIYMKMNCPPSADRNTMYQVFQLIKNKIK